MLGDFVLDQGSILLLSVIRKEKILIWLMSNGAFSDYFVVFLIWVLKISKF